MKQGLIEWLLASEPWVAYRTRLDLLEEKHDSAGVVEMRNAMLKDKRVAQLIADLAHWPGPPLNSHKKADLLLHKLSFLAELGLNKDDPGMPEVISKVMHYKCAEGPFCVPMVIPKAFGGDGLEHMTWVLTDTPLVLYSLVRMGLGEDPAVKQAATFLSNLVDENGWHCKAAPDLGKFRGPGRKDDPCPYATLIMLKALAELPEYKNSKAVHAGLETLLSLWQTRKEQHPYMFYMGTDFCKLKLPFVWYDILHVADVLSRYPVVYHDPRFQEIISLIASKANDDDKFTSESIWLAWKDWDFGQKKAASPGLTLFVQRVLKRGCEGT